MTEKRLKNLKFKTLRRQINGMEKDQQCYDVSGSCSVEYEPEQIINK